MYYVEQARSATLMWSIWGYRNGLLWSNKRLREPSRVLSQASMLLFQWTQVNLKAQNPIRQDPGDQVWCRPSPGRIKCNIDTAYDPQRSHSAFGALFRDEDRTFLNGIHGPLSFSPDPTTAEALLFAKVFFGCGVLELTRWTSKSTHKLLPGK